MCECLRRDDGTWHVDECCAHVMDEYHAGNRPETPDSSGGWIRCSERMPGAEHKPLDEYVVTFEYREGPRYKVRRCLEFCGWNGTIFYDDEGNDPEPIAWMKVEPYRGEP